mmetsp:Transcript_4606/g.8786  ORF Transcript_4606/g.8786 Transcript_4606/m.8786 type:complete len:215 (-) Transcript_4606:48-692(-)
MLHPIQRRWNFLGAPWLHLVCTGNYELPLQEARGPRQVRSLRSPAGRGRQGKARCVWHRDLQRAPEHRQAGYVRDLERDLRGRAGGPSRHGCECARHWAGRPRHQAARPLAEPDEVAARIRVPLLRLSSLRTTEGSGKRNKKCGVVQGQMEHARAYDGVLFLRRKNSSGGPGYRVELLGAQRVLRHPSEAGRDGEDLSRRGLQLWRVHHWNRRK